MSRWLQPKKCHSTHTHSLHSCHWSNCWGNSFCLLAQPVYSVKWSSFDKISPWTNLSSLNFRRNVLQNLIPFFLIIFAKYMNRWVLLRHVQIVLQFAPKGCSHYVQCLCHFILEWRRLSWAVLRTNAMLS